MRQVKEWGGCYSTSNSVWLKRCFSFFLFFFNNLQSAKPSACSQISTSQWPHPHPQVRSSHQSVPLLSRLVPRHALPLFSSFSLHPPHSLWNQLGCRVAVVCRVLTVFPVVWKKGLNKCKLISLKHSFRLHATHKTVTAHELWHCPKNS